LKNAVTFDSRSFARAETRAVRSAISLNAVALRPAACSTDRISADALAVWPAAVWMLPAMLSVVALCCSTADAMLVAAMVSCSMARAIEEI
jgi:hypothetical protein